MNLKDNQKIFIALIAGIFIIVIWIGGISSIIFFRGTEKKYKEEPLAEKLVNTKSIIVPPYFVPKTESNSISISTSSISTSIQSSITVIYPNGGEVFIRGESLFIKWSLINVERVVLDLFDNNKNVDVSNLVNLINKNNLITNWTIPLFIPEGKYWLRIGNCNVSSGICDSNAVTVFDISDAPFNIVAETTKLLPN